jgi:hypothetical protein
MRGLAPLRRQWKLALFVVLILVYTAQAVPITYKLVVRPSTPSQGIGPSGFLASVPFGGSLGDVVLTFTFEGDTANVVPFSVSGALEGIPKVNGYEIIMGTASLEIADASRGVVLAQATFVPCMGTLLPCAGIFVSIDNTNHGIGFGSFGALPSSAAFANIQPAYPYAMESNGDLPSWNVLGTYDLKSDVTIGPQGAGTSCVNFPFCSTGIPQPLPTTAGDLYVNPAASDLTHGQYENVTFTAQLHPATKFSIFDVTAQVSPLSFSCNGTFTLGSTSDGINPLAETVSLQLGTYSVTLAPGSFRRGNDGQFVFSGVINGVTLRVRIAQLGTNMYGIRARASGANLTGTTIPVTVVLTIGDDSGTTTAGTPHDHD